MIQVGQIRKDSTGTTSYLVPIAPIATVVYNKGQNDTVFYDFALDHAFEAGHTYYLRFAVQRYLYDDQYKPYGDYTYVDFNLMLCKEQGEQGSGDHSIEERWQTIEKNLILTPYFPNQNQPWQEFVVVFTPTELANYLCFKINRIGYDYVYEEVLGEKGRKVFRYPNNTPGDEENTIEFSDLIREAEIDIEVDAETRFKDRVEEGLIDEQFSPADRDKIFNIIDNALYNSDTGEKEIIFVWQGEEESETIEIQVTGEFSEVNNILGGITADKIGIQSRPGSLFVVNDEPIYLGRSGIYEVNNGTKITSVRVIAPGGANKDKIQDFILDYAYTPVEEG